MGSIKASLHWVEEPQSVHEFQSDAFEQPLANEAIFSAIPSRTILVGKGFPDPMVRLRRWLQCLQATEGKIGNEIRPGMQGGDAPKEALL